MTNFERIKEMSVEELAKFLNAYTYTHNLPPEVNFIWRNNQISVFQAWKMWLNSENTP